MVGMTTAHRGNQATQHIGTKRSFIIKFNAENGKEVKSQIVGTEDIFTDVVPVWTDEYIVIAGNTRSFANTGDDVMAAMFNTADLGNVWGTSIGSTATDTVNAIAVSGNKYSYLAGTCNLHTIDASSVIKTTLLAIMVDP